MRKEGSFDRLAKSTMRLGYSMRRLASTRKINQSALSYVTAMGSMARHIISKHQSLPESAYLNPIAIRDIEAGVLARMMSCSERSDLDAAIREAVHNTVIYELYAFEHPIASSDEAQIPE